MCKKITSALFLLVAFTSAFSQSDSSKTTFKLSGSADVYYRYNFNNPKDAPYNNFTSFTNSHNSFELGMASLKAEHSLGKVSGTIDLGFGKRAKDFSYNDEGFLASVKQLYFTYSPVNNLKITAGKWATHFDIEVPDAYLNRNYSMSYLFSYGPFFHTGVKSEYTTGKTTFMLGVANCTDYTTSLNNHKYIIAQVALASKDDKLKAYFNYHGGKTNDSFKVNGFNITAIYTFSSTFNIVSNSSLRMAQDRELYKKWNSASKWWGSALYLNADPLSWLGVTLRGEYFNDERNSLGFLGENGNVFETTLSGNFRIDNLTLIPEFRHDNAKNSIFEKHGSLTKNTTSFVLAATYHF